MSVRIYRKVSDLQGFSLKNCPKMPAPSGVLMCPPDYYDIVDIKNPFMSEQQGNVDRVRARKQWEALKEAFEDAGVPVSSIEPSPGLEDMVFCANQSLAGLTPKGEKVCVLSSMRHPSRRREVSAFGEWFKKAGYRVRSLKSETASFEGAGDAIWHPGRRLLWGGYGFRSDPEAYDEIAQIFQTPVVLLKLVNERFYHLDTCFCPLGPGAALIYPAAFDADSLELILRLFPLVITSTQVEATRRMACNAAVVGSTAIIQKGAASAAGHMKAVGLKIVEVDTSEFIKSGGSVFCLKMFTY